MAFVLGGRLLQGTQPLAQVSLRVVETTQGEMTGSQAHFDQSHEHRVGLGQGVGHAERLFQRGQCGGGIASFEARASVGMQRLREIASGRGGGQGRALCG